MRLFCRRLTKLPLLTTQVNLSSPDLHPAEGGYVNLFMTFQERIKKFSGAQVNILLHAVIWIALLTLPHLFMSGRSGKESPGNLPVSFFTITNVFHIFLFYLNAFVFYPLFFNKRSWWIFLVLIDITATVSYFLKQWLVKIAYPEVHPDGFVNRILFFPSLLFLVLSTIYRLVHDKINEERREKEMLAEQLTVKLKFLRSQVSPHFIFNVLTNLVSLARKKSDLLEPALLKLSDLMRYMLYESEENKVALGREVQYLESYIELQKLRFGTDVELDISISLQPGTEIALIEPMLLIPFVENAFKHGMGVEHPIIRVKLSCVKKHLELQVENTYLKNDQQEPEENSGIGLENVKARLILLYPGRQKLLLNEKEGWFNAGLKIDLS